MPDEIKHITGFTEALKGLQKAVGTESSGDDFARTLQAALRAGEPPVPSTDGLRIPAGPEVPSGASRPSFAEVVGGLVGDVDRLHKAAERATEKLVTGELQDVHQVVIAMEEAQTSFRLLMEVRNKMIEAYREVMRMQV